MPLKAMVPRDLVWQLSDPIRPRKRWEAKSPIQTGSEMILLVEDEERLRLLYSDALKKSGYRVVAARNGKHALELLEKHASDIALLLTDVVMPQMGGIALVKIAKDKNPRLRVLYMSGYAHDPSSDDMTEIGDTDLFSFKNRLIQTHSSLR
jgi:two-component system cell cycle sensor histidine kinase/response regulator CckA